MDKIMHFHLKDVCLDEDNPMNITTRLYADVVDMTDNLIVDACVKEARRAGINDVFLLDRKFVLDALREKIQRAQQWISVDDEYPDAKLQVLVLTHEDIWCMGKIKPCPTVRVGYTRGEDEGWFDWYSGETINPTHWLPMNVLPELQKEE